MRSRGVKRGLGRPAHGVLAVCVLLCLASGCTRPQLAGDAFVRDGVDYANTGQPFRARWWNHYERGRLLNDGAFWTAAERDLRRALRDNGVDQRWARTYGLHTIRAYFPNRELGIARFEQGHVEEGIALLRRSLEQQWSARAAHYLAEAERARIAAGRLDTEPPRIRMNAPTAGERVGARHAVLRGEVTDDTFVEMVSAGGAVQDVRVISAAVPFELRVPLEPGPNTIAVEARDIAGRTARATVMLEADLAGPIVELDPPANGILSGWLSDPAGVEQLRVNETPVPLEPESATRARFRVAIAGMVHLEARDMLGNVTRGLIRLDEAVAAAPVRLASSAGARFGPLLCATDVPRVQSTTVAPGLAIRFANLREGQEYRMEAVVATVEVHSGGAPLSTVEINGRPLDFLPDAPRQMLSHQVTLQPGANMVRALLRDTAGNEDECAVAITRVTGPFEQPAGRLTAALLPSARPAPPATADAEESAFMEARLLRALDAHARFALVSRDMLPHVLEEHELYSALGDRRARLALGNVVPAEVLLALQSRRASGLLEVTVDAVSTETGLYVGRAEVAGAARDRDAAERLIELLALRLVQEFPRVSGHVAALRGNAAIVTSLGAKHRVRESTKLVVYHLGETIHDPLTHEPLGPVADVRGEALITAVEDNRSAARMLSEARADVQVGNHVAAK